MALLKCKMCNAELNFSAGDTIVECEYCGTKQTLPKTTDENVQNLFNRANLLRHKNEFDKAEAIYEKILLADETEAEAYWGAILCKFGVEYVEDPKTYKKIPTCHRTSYDSIVADEYYKKAIQYASPAQRELYESEAKTIDSIQKGILAISTREEPYDVFICYKETDENGKRTQDSVIANDIYHQLKLEGFKVFYAAITLEDKLGSEYEPIIFAALNSSKVMLTIGTRPEYFNAVWVKNEWSRFLKIMKNDRSKLLIPCFKDMDAYELPDEFAHLQAQDMSKIGFINDVVRGIKKVISKDDSASAPAPAVTETVITSVSIAPLLKRAFMFLEDEEFERADQCFEQILNQDPENAEAYLGKLMVELEVTKREQLGELDYLFDDDKNFKKAIRFADEDLKNELNGYINSVSTNIELAEQKKKEEEKEKIYQQAKSKMASKYSYSLVTAYELFKTIADYKDTSEQITICEKQIEILKAEEKKTRFKDKMLAILASFALLVFIFLTLLFTLIIPNIKYNKAIDLMESGEYSEAMDIFKDLDDFKDSKARYEEISQIQKEISQIQSIKHVKIGDTFTFGKYEQDGSYNNAKEGIEWIALDIKDGRMLVISKYELDHKLYSTYQNNSANWETSYMRNWLNYTFYDYAFSSDEQALIQTTTVTADKNPYTTTDPGNDTQDKIFLLSVTEVEKYFTSDDARKCSCSFGSIYASWALRTPGIGQSYIAVVSSNGEILNDEYSTNYFYVRPAMWIEIPD